LISAISDKKTTYAKIEEKKLLGERRGGNRKKKKKRKVGIFLHWKNDKLSSNEMRNFLFQRKHRFPLFMMLPTYPFVTYNEVFLFRFLNNIEKAPWKSTERNQNKVGGEGIKQGKQATSKL
jgi:hypothetical protein